MINTNESICHFLRINVHIINLHTILRQFICTNERFLSKSSRLSWKWHAIVKNGDPSTFVRKIQVNINLNISIQKQSNSCHSQNKLFNYLAQLFGYQTIVFHLILHLFLQIVNQNKRPIYLIWILRWTKLISSQIILQIKLTDWFGGNDSTIPRFAIFVSSETRPKHPVVVCRSSWKPLEGILQIILDSTNDPCPANITRSVLGDLRPVRIVVGIVERRSPAT